ETGTTFAPRIANDPGSPPCPNVRGTAHHAAANTTTKTAARPRLNHSRIRTPSGIKLGRLQPPSPPHRYNYKSRRLRLVGSCSPVKHLPSLIHPASVSNKTLASPRNKFRLWTSLLLLPHRSCGINYGLPIGDSMSPKQDVWQGTLALMVLKTL